MKNRLRFNLAVISGIALILTFAIVPFTLGVHRKTQASAEIKASVQEVWAIVTTSESPACEPKQPVDTHVGSRITYPEVTYTVTGMVAPLGDMVPGLLEVEMTSPSFDARVRSVKVSYLISKCSAGATVYVAVDIRALRGSKALMSIPSANVFVEAVRRRVATGS